MAFVTLWSSERKGRKVHYIHTLDHGGPGKSDHVQPQKGPVKIIKIKIITPVTKRAIESHNLLSSYHRADDKGTHVPVGDIL